MKAKTVEDVLRFWFPMPPNSDQATMVRQCLWWFRGGADADIIKYFAPLLEQATQGELDAWADQPRSRLALIIVLDQFSRSIHRGAAPAFAQDAKACALTLAGIDIGHYAALETPWEKIFFSLPLGHSENLGNLERVINLTDELVQDSPHEHRAFLEFSAEQARRNWNVIARFGRHPHRNQALGRQSTPEELAYIAKGEFTHTRPLPPHLQQLL
jgi:uncharacterized protein (DUF924 family)